MEGEKKSSLSFGFAKKKEQKVLKKGAIEDEDKPAEEGTEFVASFDRKGLKRFIHSFVNYWFLRVWLTCLVSCLDCCFKSKRISSISVIGDLFEYIEYDVLNI